MNNNDIKNAALIAAEKEIVTRMKSSIIARAAAEAKEKELSCDEVNEYILNRIHDEMHAESDIPAPEQSLATDYITDIDTLAKSDFLRTGIRTLDNCVVGMGEGDLVSICALPGHCKSALGMQIAKRVAQQGHKVLLFSFEMYRKQVMDRYVLSDTTDIDQRSLKAGKLESEEWGVLSKTLENIKWWMDNIIIYTADTENVEQARQIDILEKIIKREKPRLVVIDQLNKIEDATTKGQPEWYRMQQNTKRVKTIATDNKCTIILEAQINSKSSQPISDSNGPGESHIKGTGAILEESDMVIVPFIYPDQEAATQKTIKIKIMKNRQGSQGHFDCLFYAQKYTIYDMVEGGAY